jgi:hypothetical protein
MNNNIGVKVDIEDLHECFVEFKKYLKEVDGKPTKQECNNNKEEERSH